MNRRPPLARPLLVAAWLSACVLQTPPDAAEGAPVPTGQLPRSVIPTAYTLELSVLPAQKSFAGRARIAVQVREPTRRIWLHGNRLRVSAASVTAGGRTIAANYRQAHASGVAALELATQLPAGEARIDLRYEADFDEQLKGLYRVEVDGEAYAFTQFEPTSARLAFPGFDEPAFKTPFDLWVTVRADHRVIANTPELSSEPVAGGLRRVHFAPTKPLPTYLVGLSVGPLEVIDAAPIPPNDVRAEPLPFRGVAVKGRGAQLRHALSHTPALLENLERYLGSPYPYAKLDVIAVPDFGAGAMENAAAITFREWYLLLDDSAGQGQRHAFASVMAHELSHHWFGNLVTMPWWDDIWLNEAFATWLGQRVVRDVHPEYRDEVHFLARVHGAMGADSRASARMIRQPIESTHDISNAFDGITYSKGGAVLAMFERYLGEDTFRQGIRAYLAARPHGTATSRDLLAALSTAAGRDVATPFSSFLNQVGVPLIEASASCDAGAGTLSLSQSRYLPLGSRAEREGRWQVPVCVRYGVGGDSHETCVLLSDPQAQAPLPAGCPDWLLPNAAAAGYYRFALPADQLARLTGAGWAALSVMEKLAVADSLEAGLDGGALAPALVLDAYARMAADPEPDVASAPMGLLHFAHDHLVGEAVRPALEARTRAWYGPVLQRLGWQEREGESPRARVLRSDVLSILADVGGDGAVRQRLAELGRGYLGVGGDATIHDDALPRDLRDLAVRIAVEDGDAALWDQVYSRAIETGEPALRGRLLDALTTVHDGRSVRALALELDPALRGNEVTRAVNAQMADPRTREAAWKWLEENFDALRKRIASNRAGSLPWAATHFCSEEGARRVEALFAPHIESLSGGPRSLAGAVEALRLCAARVAAQRAGVEAYFARPGE